MCLLKHTLSVNENAHLLDVVQLAVSIRQEGIKSRNFLNAAENFLVFAD